MISIININFNLTREEDLFEIVVVIAVQSVFLIKNVLK